MQESLKFLRQENGTDVYLDLSTGKEVYVGRPQALPAVSKRRYGRKPAPRP